MGEIQEVTGSLSFAVRVLCPGCRHRIDVATLEDDENKLGKALFGSRDTPADWDHVNFEFNCPTCGKIFRLTNIEF